MENLKMRALMELFAAGETDVEVNQAWENEFTISNQPGEYAVLTEEERDEAVKNYIVESLWAFRSSFLENMTGIPQIVFDRLSDLCEDANEAVQAIIDATCGMNKLIAAAVETDGHGHFLNSYDGNEEEVQLNGEWFYVYRIN